MFRNLCHRNAKRNPVTNPWSWLMLRFRTPVCHGIVCRSACLYIRQGFRFPLVIQLICAAVTTGDMPEAFAPSRMPFSEQRSRPYHEVHLEDGGARRGPREQSCSIFPSRFSLRLAICSPSGYRKQWPRFPCCSVFRYARRRA